MFTTYVLLTFLAVLMYFLIRTVVNEIKQHITEETDRVINAIINYLVQQPYKDVAGLLQMVQQDLQTKEEPAKEE